MAEVGLGPIVGDESNRVIENSTNDKIGIWSHEGTDAADRPGQGDGNGQCLPGDVTTPRKAPNKASLESEQSPESQELKSEMTGAAGWEQSQSFQGETRRVEHGFPLGFQDPSREHPAINPLPGQRFEQLARTQGGTAGGGTIQAREPFSPGSIDRDRQKE